ncbi:myomesin-3 [Sinocyclocheilus grahami]|uniref:myomesin-3 n=1 Tax=Sinocyclocheilus grahami TaxID=75366 RepID=UPI0007AC7B4C|nr:PREDICTED: myomesin-3 [Sinocyclocheilus grahami]
MATKIVTQRCQEEQMEQMSHSMQMSSQIKKRKFKSSDETASLSEFYPIIPGDIMSVKEILTEPKFPRNRIWEALRETLSSDELHERDQWTLFGNEAEKLEIGVIRNQRVVRERVDRLALRREAERKASLHMKLIEDLSMKAPDFPVPLRPHTVWTGMDVKLSCSVQGCPLPSVTWYKDDVPLRGSLPWNYKLMQKCGLDVLEIRRCSAEDAGEYKVIAKSSLGEATSSARLTVNSHEGAEAKLKHSWTPIPVPEPDAQLASTFPPTFVKEGDNLVLQCSFTTALLPFQQDVTWYRDGLVLHQCSRVELQTGLRSVNLTLKRVHKEHEGLYSVRLRTWDGTVEHSAYVYVKDGPAVVVGAPGSPLQVKCSDVNRDYVFLSWIPPSADGAAAVQGYFIERGDAFEITRAFFSGKHLKNSSSVPYVDGPAVVVGAPGSPLQVKCSDVNRDYVFLSWIPPSADGAAAVQGQIRVPFPPTDMRVCELSDTYAVLSWTEPEPRGREPLTYFVERSLTGKESWHLASMDMTVLSTRFAAFDQRKGKSYTYRVRSVNKYGISEPSLPSEPISVGQPLGVPAPPHGVLSIRDTNSSVLLQWKEPKITEGIVGYYLYCSEVGSGQWKTINNKPITKTRFTVDGLKTNKEYVFRVKSVGLAGNSIYSEESPAVRVKSAIYVPSRPSAITLLRCTGAEMLIGWRAPANHGGDPVRGYFLDQREKSQSSWREISIKPTKERVYEVTGLQEGRFYQFRVFAANIVGLGDASEPSELFLCERWTMPEPGCPYDLEFREVRQNSLVLLWAGPLYKGQSEVSGYVVEISEGAESEDWTLVTSEPVTETHLKVSGLQAGQTYRLRVSAVNAAGVGMSSVASEPMEAQTKAGTKEIEIGVDNDGFIFLSFEAPDSTDKDVFKWSKNYSKSTDAGRARLENKNNRSVLTFTDASEQDLGLYTVELSGNPDISSSFTFTAEDLERLTELSWHVRNPLIALKSEGWQVDVSEQGSVRLWLQTEALSSAAVLRLILNDREISSTPTRKINFDKAQGLVEILFDQISREDEGSYTAQLKDGRAKNQFTLVFVDKKFRDTLAKSEANRHNWKRKSGPHFEEFLSWTVTSDCEMIMKCKVTNVSKDTRVKWFKDGVELPQAVYEPPGVSSFTVPQVTRKELGVYRAVVSDSRGEDESVLQLIDDEFERLVQELGKQCARSAGPVCIQCTAQGFKLYCSLKYYLSYMKTSWYFKDKRIDLEERSKPGSSMQKVWIEIFGPTENDKGKYTLEMFDGQETHKRSLDLSGQAFADALLEHQRLKQVEFAEKNRARVTKGLPDVVAIMEDKSLCLTCFAEGDPAPEMFWLKNDREVTSTGQYNIKNENKSSTLTINHVTMEDSGNYSIFVRNKHGSQTVLVTVSVYKHGEKPRADAVQM